MIDRRGITRQDETSKTLFEYSDYETYQAILDGNIKSYPRKFWKGKDGYERGLKLIKYLFENVLAWSLDIIISKANNQLLYDYKLRSYLLEWFNNNATEAIMSVYPELRKQKDEVFADIKSYAIRIERIPTADEVYKMHEKELIDFYFNSYMNMMYIIKNEYSREELITILKNKFEKDNEIPKMQDMKVPQAIIYLREFGTWEKTLKEAGIN